MKQTVIIGLVLLVLGGFIARVLFPKTIERVAAPRIVTQYDTVERLDTTWLKKEVETIRWDTIYTERVVTAKPETVYVAELRPVSGVRFLSVGKKAGDSTTAVGFTVRPDTSDSTKVLVSMWQTRWWTPGPLLSLSIDTLPPRVEFGEFPVPKKDCGFFCKTGLVLAGVGVGGGVCMLAK